MLAGGLVGLFIGPGGWRVGGLAVGAEWLGWVVWSLIEAPGATVRMTRVLGGVLGNLPGFALVAVTLFLGFGIGALGGWLGSQIHALGALLWNFRGLVVSTPAGKE